MAHTAFPSDLVQAQRDWNRTYAQLAEGAPHCTTLRRRLLRLSVRLLWHPFWETERGRSPGVRVELRQQVRAQVRDRYFDRDLDRYPDRDLDGSAHDRDQDRSARDTRRVREATT
ncbi:hypothetical protein [Streptomyces sp. NPDC096193]|uniref:hypothetical protein n=1 Tax=Streptomyces sp. NPDC096193 TaxID=3155821 RepID=UPI0033348EC9